MAAGQAAGGSISAKVAALTEGVVNAMFVTKIKSVLAVVLVVGPALAGATGLIYQTQAEEPPKDDPKKVVQAPQPAEKDAPATPADKTAQKEQKVLTPDEAIKLRSKEKVTVQFEVATVQDTTQSNLYGYMIPLIILRDGGHFAVSLAPPVPETILRLRINSVKHFTGKVIRVTGVVQPHPAESSFYIVVNDLNQSQFTFVGE